MEKANHVKVNANKQLNCAFANCSFRLSLALNDCFFIQSPYPHSDFSSFFLWFWLHCLPLLPPPPILYPKEVSVCLYAQQEMLNH